MKKVVTLSLEVPEHFSTPDFVGAIEGFVPDVKLKSWAVESVGNYEKRMERIKGTPGRKVH